MFKDLFKETIWSISQNKVRSGLTILGIVIGIASVITMVAIGQGAKKSVSESIEAIGSNLIMIMPGSQRVSGINQGRGSSQTLTMEDAEAIKKQVSDIKALAPNVSGNYQITAKGNNTNTQIIGTTPEYMTVRNINITNGVFFNEQQIKISAKVAVLGPDTAIDLFGENIDPVGQYIILNKISFQVIGITEAKGGSGFNNQDDVAYIPITTAQNYLSGNDYLGGINITAENQEVMSEVQKQINQLLLVRHKISDSSEADFNIMNQNDIISTATNVTGTFTILLSSIAGISLLVGGIGIMNMMLTTVTERTREIGLRKAVGITKENINLQFLAEAVVLTFIGGVAGIILGALASLIVSYFVDSLNPSISLSSVFLAFCVSATVGIIFGFYPARKAAAMSPIEALRYE